MLVVLVMITIKRRRYAESFIESSVNVFFIFIGQCILSNSLESTLHLVWLNVHLWYPFSELHLAEVTNYDPNPALQGKLLTLVCAARGSAHMTFRWYKDQHKVETDLTQRNAWESKIPHTVQGMQLSVLNIDNVTPFDAGKICKMVQIKSYETPLH